MAVAICHSDVSCAARRLGRRAARRVRARGGGRGGARSARGSTWRVGTAVVVTLIRSCGECHHCRRGQQVACSTSFALDATLAADAPPTASRSCTACGARPSPSRSSCTPRRWWRSTTDRRPGAGVAAGVRGDHRRRRRGQHRRGRAGQLGRRDRMRRRRSERAAGRRAGQAPRAIVAVDLQPAKLDLARTLGATHVANPAADDVAAVVARRHRRP